MNYSLAGGEACPCTLSPQLSSERYAAPRPQIGGGEPLLFPEDTEALDRALQSLRLLGNRFNEHVARPLQQVTAAGAAVELGDDDALTSLIAERSAYLVDRAKAETLHLWQDDDRAATLLERWG